MSTRRRSLPTLVVRLIVVIAVIAYLFYLQSQEKKQEQPPANDPAATSPANIDFDGETAKNVVVRDDDGDIVHRGNVELSSTLDRIDSGKELDWHENDGEVFGNVERRLPKKSSGYYREWVHPTPGLRGPGPQRIITGKEGEIYYSPDHYEHFYAVPP